jgi:Kef-type K+ transport system membrane component KefB
MKRKTIIYLAVISLFSAAMWFVVDKGNYLSKPAAGVAAAAIDKTKPLVIHSHEDLGKQLIANIKHPLSLLLLQILIILAVSRICSILFTKLGQQSVIGEIFAGIFLGPSILGALFPQASEFVFPKSSLPNLQYLSQMGLAFFMFIIGMELDAGKLKNRAHDAVVISHTSIIVPFLLGMSLAYFIYGEFAPAGVTFLSFSLFMGIAMSITAFPVLARILRDRNLTKTTVGALAITCAAADDVTAWCILAVVIAIAKAGGAFSAVLTITLALAFVAIMIAVVKPLLARLFAKSIDSRQIAKSTVAGVFGVMLFSAFTAEVIGIHALFGAFIAGAVIPQDSGFKEFLSEKIEDISVLMLLPIFFAFTGLRTQIGLLNDTYLWAICGIIIFAAVAGKFGGSTFAAKLVGHSWRDSLSIGALMNTRGLMELIVLNIGYDLGILQADLFAIMVLMALVTTFMTGPSLDLITYLSRRAGTTEQINSKA